MTTRQLPKLRAQHATFVDEYFKHDMNATVAAAESGYSRTRAKQQGYHLTQRPDINAHIQARLQALSAKGILDVEKIVAMLSEMAQVDPIDFYEDNGRTLLPLSRMPKAARQCISEIKEGQFGTSIKLEGRQKALELMGKHLKMWSDAINVNLGADGQPINVIVNFGK